MDEAIAFAPGHLTGLFQICDKATDPLYKGSRGSGVSIEKGVWTKVKTVEANETDIKIYINGSVTKNAFVSLYVLNDFLKMLDSRFRIIIEHEIETPITAGFGSSGGGALSLAIALNEVFNLEMSLIEVARVAHIAEIECRTGLGSVTAALRGGLGVSIVPGGPGINKAIKFDDVNNLRTVYQYFGQISTKEVLSDPRLRYWINQVGGRFVDELFQEFTPDRFMRYSRRFSEFLNLITPQMRKVLEVTDATGKVCTMAMFGEVVFSVLEEPQAYELAETMQEVNTKNRVEVTKIDEEGAKLIQ
jgi:pantoate kinase